jgi:hypothetical protein
LLLRFAVETANDELATSCISAVRTFVRRLQDLRDIHGWELGNHCLVQCEAIIERLSKQGRPQQSIADTETLQDPDQPSVFDTPVNWLDSSLMVSFGDLGANGPERDLWDLLGLDDNAAAEYLF